MIRKFLIPITILFAIIFSHNTSSAYDGSVHSIINEKVAKEASQLDLVLKMQLGITMGIDSEIEKDGKKKEIWQWIAYGGKAEDFGWYGAWDIPRSRAFNHFHDPLKSWNEAGLDDQFNSLYIANYRRPPVSPIIWGLNPGQQDFDRNATGDWSWGKAREYFYTYLTGNDLSGNTVAVTQAQREAVFADCFRAVGQVMHLLEDMSVPLHTRNDVHVFPLFDIVGLWTYETYAKKNIKNLDYNPDQPGDRPHPDLLADPQPESGYTDLAPVTGLFDRNLYNIGDAIPASDAIIGLAEYSNANFLTNDTMFTYQHPSLSETNYDAADWLNATLVVAKDGVGDNRIYFRKTVGEPIEHLMAAGYWYYQLFMWNKPELYYAFIVDEVCFADYAAKLIPRAVGYSATLLDYFFRGRIGINTANIVKDNAGDITGIECEIRNTTFSGQGQSVEPFENGDITLSYHYTPAGQNLPVFGLVENIYTISSANDPINSGYVSLTINFNQNNLIPGDARDISFTLVFRGKLGNEEDAVVGKRFSVSYKIAYFYQPGGPPNTSNVYTVLPDGSSKSNMTYASEPNTWYYSPAWSPDGTMLAYEEETCSEPDHNPEDFCPGEYYSREIVVVGNTANVLANLSLIDDAQFPEPDEVLTPSFSPDGNRIVAGIDVQSRLIWALAIFDMSDEVGSYVGGIDFWMDKDISGSGPAWSPQGDNIAYYLRREFDDSSGQWDFKGDLCLINPDGTGNINLTNDNFINVFPSWSPDGQSIVFNSNREGGMDIWMMDGNGANPERILNCTADCYYPVFSPDGEKIIFEQSGDIKMVDLNDQQITTITTSGNVTGGLSVSPEVMFPVTISFEAFPSAISEGQPIKLIWSVTNADTISIDHEIGSVAADGIIEVTPGTTYTMTVDGQGGTLTQTVTVLLE